MYAFLPRDLLYVYNLIVGLCRRFADLSVKLSTLCYFALSELRQRYGVLYLQYDIYAYM